MSRIQTSGAAQLAESVTGGAAPLGSPPRRGSRAVWLLWLVPAVAAAAVYWRSLGGGLVWDDTIVQKNQMVAFTTIESAFNFDARKIYQWSPYYYRPMVTLSYMLDERISNALRDSKVISAAPLPIGIRTDPRVSHVSCVAYHVIATFFAWMFARQVLNGQAWKEIGALAAGLVFAVHPIHTETVCMINGRSDSLAAMFVLPAVVAAMRYFRRPSAWALGLSAVLFFGGLMSKEVALGGALLLPFLWLAARFAESGVRPASAEIETPAAAMPATIGGVASQAASRTEPRRYWSETELQGAWRAEPRRYGIAERLWGLIPLVVAAAVYAAAVGEYFYLRAAMNITPGRPLGVPWAEMAERFATAMAYYMTKAFWPWPQCHFPAEMPPAWLGWIVVSIVAVVGVLSLVLAARRKMLLLTCMGWILCTLAPSMGIALRGGSETPVAERYLYLPVLGVGLLLAGLIGVCWSRVVLRAGAIVVALAATGGYAYGTWQRGEIWLDNVALWVDATEKFPKAGLPWFTLGMAYMEQGKLDDAERCFKTSIDCKYTVEGYSLAWNSLGVVHLKRNDFRKALECFGKSIQFRPTYQTPYFNIGNIMMMTAEQKFAQDKKWDVEVLGKAHLAYSKAIECYRIYTWAYLERGKCSAKMATERMMARDAGGAAKHLQAAVQDLNVVIKLEPQSAYAADARKLAAAIEQQLAKLPAPRPAAPGGAGP